MASVPGMRLQGCSVVYSRATAPMISGGVSIDHPPVTCDDWLHFLEGAEVRRAANAAQRQQRQPLLSLAAALTLPRTDY